MRTTNLLLLALSFTFFAVSCSKKPDDIADTDPVADEEIVDSAEDDALAEEEEKRREAAAKKRKEAQAKLAKMRADASKKARADAEKAKKKRDAATIASRKAKATGARQAIVGTTLATIKTKEGTYTNAKINKATDLALTIFHATGANTIPYPDLPLDLQKKLHYHKDDYAEAKAALRSASVAQDSSTKDISAARSTGKPNTSASAPKDDLAAIAKKIEQYKKTYQTKKGEFAAMKKLMKQKRGSMAEFQRALSSRLRKATDEKELMKIQSELGDLMAKEAMILAEIDSATPRMRLSPYQYREMEALLDQYRKVLVEWHKMKGNIRIGRDKASRMERLVSRATVRDASKEAQVAKLEAQVAALEVKEQLKNAEVNAFREKVRDARFAAQDKERSEARKKRKQK